MTRLFYMSHPLSGDIPGNLARAKRWLAYLYRALPGIVCIAPWIHDVEALPLRDHDPAERALGLERCLSAVERCDGILLVGDRISDGMRLEMARAQERGLEVMRWITTDGEPPSEDEPRRAA